MAFTTHYHTLGVGRNADHGEIKKAYQRLALNHHPDKGGNPEDFRLIQEAYEILREPAKRASYNARLPRPSPFDCIPSSKTIPEKQKQKHSGSKSSQFDFNFDSRFARTGNTNQYGPSSTQQPNPWPKPPGNPWRWGAYGPAETCSTQPDRRNFTEYRESPAGNAYTKNTPKKPSKSFEPTQNTAKPKKEWSGRTGYNSNFEPKTRAPNTEPEPRSPEDKEEKGRKGKPASPQGHRKRDSWSSIVEPIEIETEPIDKCMQMASCTAEDYNRSFVALVNAVPSKNPSLPAEVRMLLKHMQSHLVNRQLECQLRSLEADAYNKALRAGKSAEQPPVFYPTFFEVWLQEEQPKIGQICQAMDQLREAVAVVTEARRKYPEGLPIADVNEQTRCLHILKSTVTEILYEVLKITRDKEPCQDV